jgi:glycosyltransferase involved in cell wall biosynthesis
MLKVLGRGNVARLVGCGVRSPGPRTSVVIPCYKQADYVAAAAKSALAGDEAGRVEVVVVDDGSPDDVVAALADIADDVLLIRQKNAGLAAARNAGLARATGDWVVFLDADDELTPGSIAAQHRVAGDADAVCAGWFEIDEQGETLREFAAPTFAARPEQTLLPINLAPPVCYLFRREAVDAVGGFGVDPALHGHEDWDILLRLAANGCQFTSADDARVRYRVAAGSMSKNIGRMALSAVHVLRQMRGRFKNAETLRRVDLALTMYRDAVLRHQIGGRIRRSPFAGSAEAVHRLSEDPGLVPILLRSAVHQFRTGRRIGEDVERDWPKPPPIG